MNYYFLWIVSQIYIGIVNDRIKRIIESLVSEERKDIRKEEDPVFPLTQFVGKAPIKKKKSMQYVWIFKNKLFSDILKL